MTPKSAKAKGKELEEHVAIRLRATGLDITAERNGDSGAGNKEKGDIKTNLTIGEAHAHIECKNHARPSIGDWWKQAKDTAAMTHSEPILIFKLGGERYDDAKAVISLETLIDLIKAAQGIEITTSVDITPTHLRREADNLSYAVKSLADEAKKENPDPRRLTFARSRLNASAREILATIEHIQT